jgi:hypothetical protein
VVEDVVFHEFRHQAVDCSAGGSEAAENLGALLIVIQSLMPSSMARTLLTATAMMRRLAKS